MLELIFLIVILILSFFVFLLYRKASSLEAELADLASRKQSLSTRYGQISEQWLPLMESFPYDPKQFRFLGSPVDGIAFNDDKIVFCEFKFADSKLSERQRNIKRLVEEGRVEWKEFRVK